MVYVNGGPERVTAFPNRGTPVNRRKAVFLAYSRVLSIRGVYPLGATA
jgi:hypothetical protein